MARMPAQQSERLLELLDQLQESYPDHFVRQISMKMAHDVSGRTHDFIWIKGPIIVAVARESEETIVLFTDSKGAWHRKDYQLTPWALKYIDKVLAD